MICIAAIGSLGVLAVAAMAGVQGPSAHNAVAIVRPMIAAIGMHPTGLATSGLGSLLLTRTSGCWPSRVLGCEPQRMALQTWHPSVGRVALPYLPCPRSLPRLVELLRAETKGKNVDARDHRSCGDRFVF